MLPHRRSDDDEPARPARSADASARLGEFHVVRKEPDAPLTVVARRRVRTLEGRIARTPLGRVGPTAAVFLGITTVGELLTLLHSGRAGITVHAIALLLLVTHAALTRRSNPALSDLLISLTPVPLIRIVSLTSPLAEFSYIQWFTVLSIILYAGIVTSMKILKPTLAEVGLRLPERKHLPLEIAVILLGFFFGWLEYQILTPGSIIATLSIQQLIAPILVLYVATGLLEELLFRGLIQKYANRAMGAVLGIGLTTILFGVLHIGWNSVADVFFVASVGLIYSLVVHRTKSIIGVSISHGVTNSMLFLVMPFVQPM